MDVVVGCKSIMTAAGIEQAWEKLFGFCIMNFFFLLQGRLSIKRKSGISVYLRVVRNIMLVATNDGCTTLTIQSKKKEPPGVI